MNNPTTPPFFLGIGPPKTATTWVYKNLVQHPSVSLPPMKEIGYLWEKYFLPERTYMSRFLSSHWHYKPRRRYILGSVRDHLKNLISMRIDRNKLLWDFKYSLLPHTDSWYSSLFEQQLLSGDITAKYCELNEANIADIRSRYGETKIIITVRDPVEREWSRAKMNLSKRTNRKPNEIPEHEWIHHFDESELSLTNDYTALYERWSRSFGEENIHLIFIDEIALDGWKVFKELCQFLEINQPSSILKDQILKPANVGIVDPIPRNYEKYLFLKHREKITRFANRFPSYPYHSQWLERHKSSAEI